MRFGGLLFSGTVALFVSELTASPLGLYKREICDDENGENLKDILENRGLKTLEDAIDRIDATDLLEGYEDYTIFAPSEEVLKENAALLDSLTDDELAELIKRHVVREEFSEDELSDGIELVTIGGETVIISEDEDGNMLVNGAIIDESDNSPCNGVVHIIDSILFPVDIDGGGGPVDDTTTVEEPAETEEVTTTEAAVLPEETTVEELPAETTTVMVPEETLTEAVPEETVAETTVAEEPVPETTVAEEPVPETTVAEEPVPETTVAEEPVPETTVAEEPVPETTVAEEPVPETTVAEEPVPETTVVEETTAVVAETTTVVADPEEPVADIIV